MTAFTSAMSGFATSSSRGITTFIGDKKRDEELKAFREKRDTLAQASGDEEYVGAAAESQNPAKPYDAPPAAHQNITEEHKKPSLSQRIRQKFSSKKGKATTSVVIA
ncbi:hypothetical protein BX600DRAFT_434635 [Xylariales sp. PMI_506]|nr:hypothetical protein BX600DRAFT_434635 [Xylariales sp. PMI_506]